MQVIFNKIKSYKLFEQIYQITNKNKKLKKMIINQICLPVDETTLIYITIFWRRAPVTGELN